MKERANRIIFSFLSCKHFYICGCNRVHQKGQRNYISELIFSGVDRLFWKFSLPEFSRPLEL